MPHVLAALTWVVLAGPLVLPSGAWLAAPANSAQIKSVALLPARPHGHMKPETANAIDALVAERLAVLAPNMRVVVHPDLTDSLGPGAVKAAQKCDKAPCLAKLAGTFGTDSVMFVGLSGSGSKIQLRLVWVDAKKTVLGKRAEPMGNGHADWTPAVTRAFTGILGPGAQLGASAPAGDPSVAPLDEILGWLQANVRDYEAGSTAYVYDWSHAMADCTLQINERVDKKNVTVLANAKLMDASHFRMVQEGRAFGVTQECPYACSDVVQADNSKQQRKQVTLYVARKAVAERLLISLARWATLCNPHPP